MLHNLIQILSDVMVDEVSLGVTDLILWLETIQVF